jgi:hypothetical protein
MTQHVRDQTLVRHVDVNQVAGCLVVDHDQDGPATLIQAIRHHVRGWDQADNGEIDLDVHEGIAVPLGPSISP